MAKRRPTIERGDGYDGDSIPAFAFEADYYSKVHQIKGARGEL